MREILFRAKRLDNGEWVEGDFTRYSKVMGYIDVDLIEGKVFQVDRSTLGQFTGLTDKNGKLIFEGDIVTINGGRPLEIKFYNFEWVATSKKNGLYLLHRLEYRILYEVIGNIYDTPLLLEGGENNG